MIQGVSKLQINYETLKAILGDFLNDQLFHSDVDVMTVRSVKVAPVNFGSNELSLDVEFEPVADDSQEKNASEVSA